MILVVHLAAEPAATGTERRRTDLLAGAAAVAVVAGAVVAAVADLFTVGPIVAVAGTLLVCLAILWATRVGTRRPRRPDGCGAAAHLVAGVHRRASPRCWPPGGCCPSTGSAPS